jgi:hypothetical protein
MTTPTLLNALVAALALTEDDDRPYALLGAMVEHTRTCGDLLVDDQAEAVWRQYTLLGLQQTFPTAEADDRNLPAWPSWLPRRGGHTLLAEAAYQAGLRAGRIAWNLIEWREHEHRARAIGART